MRLIFTRNKSEQIVIGDGTITITIVEIRDNKVRIGVEAPRSISVHRAEIQELLNKDKKEEPH